MHLYHYVIKDIRDQECHFYWRTTTRDVSMDNSVVREEIANAINQDPLFLEQIKQGA